MFLWSTIQVCLLLLVFLIIVTQVVIPALDNKPLFWFFRKPDSELLDVNRELSDLNVAEKVKKVKDQIKEKTEKLKERKFRK